MENIASPGTVIFVRLHDVVNRYEPEGKFQLVCDFVNREEESTNDED
jgi:hypothetical protein